MDKTETKRQDQLPVGQRRLQDCSAESIIFIPLVSYPLVISGGVGGKEGGGGVYSEFIQNLTRAEQDSQRDGRRK